MLKLSDTQAILLTTAANRDNGSLLPLPGKVGPSGTAKAIAALLKQGLAEERETTDATAVHRIDSDIRYGLFAAPAGLAAIGIGNSGNVATSPPPPEPRASKVASVLALLQRAEGATLAELIALTGWLPHTTRAALTGLRKRGHTIERGKRDDVTCYRSVAA